MLKKYSNQIKQRQDFRMNIIDFVMGGREAEAEEDAGASGDDLTSREKALLKYYYYIRFGMDTEYISPIDEQWIDNILAKIPAKLKQRSVEVGQLLSQVKVKSMTVNNIVHYLV
uniref:Dynein heavy chain 7, axonemal n=1 Tax=Cacopsylla melanoneura TaxID=428564 RepID=A0A8D8ZEJ7_9HEMI